MALQGALFILGLLILAAVFWFSGGRELIEQKRSPRRRKPSSAATRSLDDADDEAEKKSKSAQIKEKIRNKVSAQNSKRQSAKSGAGKSKRKTMSSWFERKEKAEPKLDIAAKEKTHTDRWGDHADDLDAYSKLDSASDNELLDQYDDYGAEYGAEHLDEAHNQQVPEYLRIGADQFKGVRVDYFATISGDQAVTLDEVMTVYQQTEFELAKSHDIYGCSVSDNRWRNLKNEFESDREYGEIALTLQLADRDGPVNQSHLTRFSSLVLRVSEALDRKFRFSSSFEDALEHAHNLDDFCQQYDVVAAIYVLARDGTSFAGLSVDAAARANSLYLGYKDIYHQMAALNGSSYSIFSMANMHNPGTFDEASLDITETQGLVFFINMPCTPQPADAYQSMVIAAEAICDELDGILVDQHRKAVNRKSLESVRQQIDQIAQDMRAEGLNPGSVEAMRLFG